MNDLDSTLAEDFDWALFPREEARVPALKRWLRRLEVVLVLGLVWIIRPSLAVVLACLAVSHGDFRAASLASRSIPDRAAARVCSLFGYAWWGWTLGVAAFAIGVVAGAARGVVMQEQTMPSEVIAAFLLMPCGFLVAFGLTAVGLILALRGEMRVWIGEGLNQARILLLGLLIIMFMIFGIFPLLVVLGASFDRSPETLAKVNLIGVVLLASLFVGPVVILIILDRIAGRVLASHPGKFGPKVPSVKKAGG